MRRLLRAGLLSLGLSWVAGATPLLTPPDAVLRNTQDSAVMLSSLRGKPTVLIYEDRDSLELNRPFKTALRERAGTPRGGGEVQVVAVANVAGYNFFPMRGLALHHVRDAERKAGHPLLVDWENVLARPPWNLPPHSSSVLVLSPTGEVLFARSGKLTDGDQTQVFALLERLCR